MTRPRAPAAGIARLLRPGSIAILGASDKPGSLGASVLANLERNGFAGVIHLINPNRATIAGRPCLASAADLPEDVDAAVLAIPRAGVLDGLRALATRRAGSAIIFSAGFAEDGEAGLADQRDIAAIAAAAGMVVEGPNCLGLVNHIDRIPLTFVETDARPPAGRPAIGIVSQSGAMAAVLGTMLMSRDLPLSFSISTGNEAASAAEDYIDFLVDEPATRTIALIIEQFRDAQRFLACAARARKAGKTLVLLHPGRSAAARLSAATHTGALAGDHAVMRAKVARAGVVLVDTLEELADCAEIAVRAPCLPRGGAAIIGESGAFKALALDLSEALKLDLADVGADTSPALRAALPPFVGVSNPLDLTAQGLVDPALYKRVLDALLADSRFGAVVMGVIQTNPATVAIKLPPILAALRRERLEKTVILAGLDEGAAVPQHFIDNARACGVPYFPSPERALRALARLAQRSLPPATAERTALDLPALPGTGGMLAEYAAKGWLEHAGIVFPRRRLVTTLGEASEAASALGYPVVLKAQSASLSHKSDAGGVILHIGDSVALDAAWRQLHANVAATMPGLPLDGVLVECMSPRGIELIIGARRDSDWGTILLVGAGGVLAEMMQDSTLITPDQTESEIAAAIGKLACGKMLRGFRGAPPADIGAVVRLVGVLSRVMEAAPRITEIDLNPIMVLPSGQGALALDALIALRT